MAKEAPAPGPGNLASPVAIRAAGAEQRHAAGDRGLHVAHPSGQRRGRQPPGREGSDHRGALPPLPPTWLNIYVADGPARKVASDFAGYLRRVVCEVAAAA